MFKSFARRRIAVEYSSNLDWTARRPLESTRFGRYDRVEPVGRVRSAENDFRAILRVTAICGVRSRVWLPLWLICLSLSRVQSSFRRCRHGHDFFDHKGLPQCCPEGVIFCQD
jgi:hypothetical protein